MEKKLSELKQGDQFSLRDSSPSFEMIVDSIVTNKRILLRIINLLTERKQRVYFPHDLSIVYHEPTVNTQ